MISVNLNRPRCYRIVSDKTGVIHDIDLEALAGNGHCDCANFIFRMEGKVQLGQWGLMCKHIIAARKFELFGGNDVYKNPMGR